MKTLRSVPWSSICLLLCLSAGDAGGFGSQPQDTVLASAAVSPGNSILNITVPADIEPFHLKWSQPPIQIDPNLDPNNAPPIFCGWHEPARSTENTGQKRQWRMTVDDFHCLGHIPVTRLRWWGTYKAWRHEELPESLPEMWHLGFWSRIEDSGDPNEMFPERLMWSVEIPPERVAMRPAGLVEYSNREPEVCFECDLVLEPHEWFWPSHFPARGDIFWLGITAVYPVDAVPSNQWGWLTRPQAWRDGALNPAILSDWPNQDERLFPGRIYPITIQRDCPTDEVYDMAFGLFTEFPWGNWDQPLVDLRQWPWVADKESLRYEPNEPDEPVLIREVADDWIYEGDDPVIALSWQGSYSGYGYEAGRCENLPAPRRPDYFQLQILADDGNQPGDLLWDYPAFVYDEVMVNVDRRSAGEPNEAVFRYSVRLDREHTFDRAEPDQHLWFKVVAVYQDLPDHVPYPWGWTTRDHIHDSAALSRDMQESMPAWRLLRSSVSQPVDMSFTFYTTPPIEIPAGAEAVASYLRDSLWEGSFHGQVLWMSPGPLEASEHIVRDLRRGRGEVSWPAETGHWWLTMIDATPQAEWPHDVLWVYVREDLALYRPWASTYPPEIYRIDGEHVPIHCIPLDMEGLGVCR